MQQNCFKFQRSSHFNSYCLMWLKEIVQNKQCQPMRASQVHKASTSCGCLSFSLLIWVKLLHQLVFPTSSILHKSARKTKNKNIKTTTTVTTTPPTPPPEILPNHCQNHALKIKRPQLGAGKGPRENVLNTSLFPEIAESTLTHQLIRYRKAKNQSNHFFNLQTRSLISSNGLILTKYHCN